MSKFYTGFSKKINSDERNKFLSESEERLQTNFTIFNFRYRIDNENYNAIRHIVKTIKKGNSNRLSEEKVQAVINFFHETMHIKENPSLSGDDLVTYMYQLSNEYYNQNYENFVQEIRSKSSTSEQVTKQSIKNSEPEKKSSLVSKYQRNITVAEKGLITANYLCEVDSNHMFFTSATTGKNYVEAHHLVPLSLQKQFKCNLDVLENISCLCVVCHKKIHHSIFEEKVHILTDLFRQREEGFNKIGLNIDLNSFLTIYKSELIADN
ncbi:HNH endonuclease [Bacillus sp. NPDC077027]|uniref:HNH endonuclease n=1 Tax=Bacillus sp. NPDC077027 TaxID=3390548 RepID=UPI003CFFF59F